MNAGLEATGAIGLEDHRARVLALMEKVSTSRLHWVPRHRNGDADRLSQQAIEQSPAEEED